MNLKIDTICMKHFVGVYLKKSLPEIMEYIEIIKGNEKQHSNFELANFSISEHIISTISSLLALPFHNFTFAKISLLIGQSMKSDSSLSNLMRKKYKPVL